MDLLQIGGVIIPERGNLDRTTEAEIEIGMTTVVDRRAPHHVVEEQDIETATEKDIVLRAMTAAAEVIVEAAVHDGIVHTLATRARKS